MTPVLRRDVCSATSRSFSSKTIRASYWSASQKAVEVPSIPPPMIATSHWSKLRVSPARCSCSGLMFSLYMGYSVPMNRGAKRFFPLTPSQKRGQEIEELPDLQGGDRRRILILQYCGTPLFLAPMDDSGSRVRKKRLTSIMA